MTYEEYKQKRLTIESQYITMVNELIDLLFKSQEWPMCDAQELIALFFKEHEIKSIEIK